MHRSGSSKVHYFCLISIYIQINFSALKLLDSFLNFNVRNSRGGPDRQFIRDPEAQLPCAVAGKGCAVLHALQPAAVRKP